MSESDTVYEITEGAAGDCAGRYCLPQRGLRLSKKVEKKARQDCNRDPGDDRCESREQTKCRTAVFSVFQPQPAIDNLDPGSKLPGADRRCEDKLRQLVDYSDGRSDGNQN